MRVCFIHDWLFGMRGGERCLEVLCELFPDASVFSLFYQPERISDLINARRPVASMLQKLPAVERYYRYLLPLYPLAARDLGRRIARAEAQSGPFDLVLSVSHCAAKNVPLRKGLKHVCYCLTPMRYLWDQYDAYFARSPLEPAIRQVMKPLRAWDVGGASGVTSYISISEFVRARLKRVYGRDSAVVYPPVRTDWISPRAEGEPGEAFLSVSAMVPYKNVDVVVQAFNELGLPLVIVGGGPEEPRLRSMARNNIRFVGRVSDEELARLYRTSRALVFAAEEDFGMSPVEMQAAGRPVIAWGRGGALETVSTSQESPTGVLFSELSPQSVVGAVREFIDREAAFTVGNCLKSARNFSADRFREDMLKLLSEHLPQIDAGKFLQADRSSLTV